MNPFAIIKEELPKFFREMNVPFLGRPQEQRSVMAPPRPQDREREMLENIAVGGVLANPAMRAAGQTLRLMAAAPRTSAVGVAAATQDPTALFLGPAGVLSSYSPTAQGAIRPGGRFDLNMTHQLGSDIGDFLDLLTGRRSLTAPSIAISRSNAFPFGRDESASLVMNPASHAFDPRYNRFNQLFNRDAYTLRARDPRETKPLRGDTWNKMTLAPADARMTEGVGGGPVSLAHRASIWASPRFHNLAEYERSPYGATNLRLPNDQTPFPDYRFRLEKLANQTNVWDPEKLVKDILSERYQAFRTGRPDADVTNALLYENLRTMPSNYAELKLPGELEISPKNISAMILPRHFHSSETPAVVKELKDLMGDIPTGTVEDLAPERLRRVWRTLANKMTETINENADTFRRLDDSDPVEAMEFARRSYEETPDFFKKYLPQNRYEAALYTPDIFSRNILRDMIGTPAAAGDVASFYTDPKLMRP
jgi:hypothetical protein